MEDGSDVEDHAVRGPLSARSPLVIVACRDNIETRNASVKGQLEVVRLTLVDDAEVQAHVVNGVVVEAGGDGALGEVDILVVFTEAVIGVIDDVRIHRRPSVVADQFPSLETRAVGVCRDRRRGLALRKVRTFNERIADDSYLQRG